MIIINMECMKKETFKRRNRKYLSLSTKQKHVFSVNIQGGKRTSQSCDFFYKDHIHLVNKTLASDKKISLCAVHTLQSKIQ